MLPWLPPFPVEKTWDESKHPRDDAGRFVEWHEQAGRTANEKPDAEHAGEAESHRAALMKLPASRLRAIADHVGFHIRPGMPKEKIVAGLIAVVTTRRGMSQRSEQ